MVNVSTPMNCTHERCCSQTIFLMSIVEYSELDYKRPTGTYVYPDWAVGIGWSLAAASAVCIPAVAVYNTVSVRMSGKVRTRLGRITLVNTMGSGSRVALVNTVGHCLRVTGSGS